MTRSAARSVRTKHRDLLQGETNLLPRTLSGTISICLVSPNHYKTGMSGLGFQKVYSLLASEPDIRCERAFLPDRGELAEYRRSNTPLLSLETSTPVGDFDVIAFSTSFEPDYLNIPLLLDLARIPPLAADRTDSDPLVIAGGAAFFINPEPVADLIDIICIGEGEDLIPALLAQLLATSECGRDALLNELGKIPGVYVPSFYLPCYHEGRFTGFTASESARLPVSRTTACPEMHDPASTVIITDNSEFGDMFLIEVSRGCPRGCRFCSSGFIYGAFRQYRSDKIISIVDSALLHRQRIGLVGAAVSDYAGIGPLCSEIVARGGKVSVSSLRIDRIDREMLDALIVSGHKTISLAPEGGSQRIRDLMRKNLSEEQILDTCDMLIAHDILNLKLYFIIGLPGENENDLNEMIRLVETIRGRVIAVGRSNGRLGEITVSVNPFIPKPFTPFQWCGMEPLDSLEKKARHLERSFGRLSNVKLKIESLRESYLQALLSRGDRRLAPLLLKMSEGVNLKNAAKLCGINTKWYVERTIGGDEPLPWSIIESADHAMLSREYERGFAEGSVLS